MSRCLAVAVSLLFVVSARAQQPQPIAVRFVWKAGQTHSFLVTQTTTVTETVLNDSGSKPTTTTTTTKLTLTRTWTVKDVDAAGAATVEMAIAAFRQETTRAVPGADGKPVSTTDVLDGAVPADRAKLPFLGKPMLTAKVDARGLVGEAKSESGEAAVARLRAELPFRVALPADPIAVNAKWDRPFTVKLDPPQGAGEVYEFNQTATFRGVNQGFAVIGVSTALKTPPSNPGELLPLVPSLWEGDVFVNQKTGVYAGAKLTAKKDVPNHQGEGTKFSYVSEYTEAVADAK
jgi:hypothetical protein